MCERERVTESDAAGARELKTKKAVLRCGGGMRRHLHRVFVGLLKDECEEVRDALVAKLPTLFPLLVPASLEANEEAVQALNKVHSSIQVRNSAEADVLGGCRVDGMLAEGRTQLECVAD